MKKRRFKTLARRIGDTLLLVAFAAYAGLRSRAAYRKWRESHGQA